MKKLLKNLVSSQKLCTFAPAFDKQRSVLSEKCSGFSAVGSAHVWGARGRWFESSNPDSSEGVENKRVSAPFLFSPISLNFGASDGNRDKNNHGDER